ncbi:Peptidyl-tRNA hydrolase [hydrothermal vent metagenome]|uniref:peptidyl-tRNA hydrolase n=1 Tax=hydrothermal vent metagenome TaxID=652676 RepID=A0A3B1BH14_9ZZZZ
MKLVVGLGNPGARYKNTRHNAGFMALDGFLQRFGLATSGGKFQSPFLSTHLLGQGVAFIKPAIYMNLSGGPVKQAVDSMGLSTHDLLVMHDDIDIALGEVRYKTGGGHGGHNGLKSIIAELGDAGFSRIRIGVSRPPQGAQASDYVLDEVGRDEMDALAGAFEKAFEFLEKRFLNEPNVGRAAST